MSQYFEFTPNQNEYQTLRFIDNGVTGCEVKTFDAHVVAVSGTTEQVAALIALQPAEIGFTEIGFDAFFAKAIKSTQAQFALKNIDAQMQAELDELSGYCGAGEVASWARQETEARAFVKSSTATTPLIDALVLSRGKGESRSDLAAKIIASADAYAIKSGEIIGKAQVKRKAVFE
jgi:hypothetical protein